MASEQSLYWIRLGIVFGIVLLLLDFFVFIIKKWIPFQKERKYILMEIARNDGDEQMYWKWELEDLYHGMFPWLRWLFKNNEKNIINHIKFQRKRDLL